MNQPIREPRGYGFAVGLAAGTCVGAGLALWFAPRLRSELRERTTDSARGLQALASEQYQQASARASAAVDELTEKGQGIRNDVADAVVRGARAVERYAETVKTS